MTNNLNESATIDTIVKTIKRENPLNLRQLVLLLKKQLKLPEKEIVNLILKLQEEGIIRFEQPPSKAPKNFLSYLKTSNAYWYRAIITLTSAAATVIFAIPENAYPWIYIRYALAILFVIWLPGYALTKTLYVDVSLAEKNLNSAESAGLGIGLSLAIVSITGLLLNYTPWGIRFIPIVLSLSVLTLILATTAVKREYQKQRSTLE